MNRFEQIVTVITEVMPREILSFILDQDILIGTVCGYSIGYLADTRELSEEYVIGTNNRWFGFDGWQMQLDHDPYLDFKLGHNKSEFETHICLVYDSMLKKVEEYYERS